MSLIWLTWGLLRDRRRVWRAEQSCYALAAGEQGLDEPIEDSGNDRPAPQEKKVSEHVLRGSLCNPHLSTLLTQEKNLLFLCLLCCFIGRKRSSLWFECVLLEEDGCKKEVWAWCKWKKSLLYDYQEKQNLCSNHPSISYYYYWWGES